MYDSALTKKASDLFPKFRRFKNFYLVGGTALALQIGHRLSVDFDFFTRESLPKNLLSRVKQIFTDSSFHVTYRSPEQLNVFINEVKITFFQYEYPIVQQLVKYKNIPMASTLEIAAMKAFAIGKRLSYKDYIDWYFLLKEKHVNLKQVIQLANKKFGGDFNDRLFLGQLVSMTEIPVQKIIFLKDKPSQKRVHNYLKKIVKDYQF
ncbi:MAG: hypothetical protein A3B74_04635 [Candidatus Kerfeldbacteria bacterium RIFCSPHIGHO2_02_FULL_42_14]|uniref:Nucleotidyl transferase AbiEii/AbiGii toxin family protein n=1 Tax=Candidatus Kerfeldbacteria bacterium RIFCSPHIGHO2_02_FULL_42_14 TaxID=1798540 RepID=A0A1G2AQ63_9BACT|nr:MAG: hypothetical protein A3B74_04635 [Candidatus Kerfeldbacteria bacterium RIFCSPHIGHO2_02_FULL_42_14]OGY81013.1 MAG: hypothetical protein A3E60_03355 [Candidatus Kerfeldbacteria bacterium RIFCSPHIGHO2_12_FULL_42_13]OGY84953.1 MAG: hypothetical protein A3I91_00520 [Candidatus Kerfeldbacteria bacterium RIFCSPLOWO2_02_FULL_42_19]OGY86120.1 MAG: hypothetical protein A3G01_02050 [Candidatus Kerfeldbacteria bacterium RIFCSPLOWO2_12_FULL_43_9]